MTDPDDPSPFDRRSLLRGAGALSLGSLFGSRVAAAPAAAAPVNPLASRAVSKLVAGGGCILTPSSIQGPFYLDLGLLRQDITEGKPGLPVTLIFKVVNASDGCSPVPNAVVDVWQCDALGSYSGFPSEGTAGETFLRGIQITNLDGLVFFQTVFPGWYPGRTAHWHVKVYPSQDMEVTTQFYFDQWVTDIVNEQLPPYDTKGANSTTNTTDAFYLPENKLVWILDPSGAVALWAGTLIGIA